MDCADSFAGRKTHIGKVKILPLTEAEFGS